VHVDAGMDQQADEDAFAQADAAHREGDECGQK